MKSKEQIIERLEQLIDIRSQLMDESSGDKSKIDLLTSEIEGLFWVLEK